MTLFPEIEPYETGMLPVDAPHEIYYEQCGNPDGIPVVYLHGGPGGKCGEQARRFFDPASYRIILFDQRGAGRSKPHAHLEDNTTAHLVDDIEAIRKHLQIDQWALFGGSWGSTLSILYAQAHPQRVSSMILRGIFLCRDADLQWFYQHGASLIFPDYWKEYLEPVAEEDRHNMIKAYYRLLTGNNELAKMQAAKHWSLWEGRCATFRPNNNVIDTFCNTHFAVALARIEAHYFINQAFIKPNQILDNMDIISDIPATIIHGRYDMVCPIDNAFSLHERWANSELHIIRDAGHASREPSILDALIKATDSLAFEIETKA